MKPPARHSLAGRKHISKWIMDVDNGVDVCLVWPFAHRRFTGCAAAES